MIRFARLLVLALPAASLYGAAVSCDAAIIDTFSFPGFIESVETSSNNNFSLDEVTQTSLDPSQVLGGERYFSADTSQLRGPASDTSASASATMNGSAADPSFDIAFQRPGLGLPPRASQFTGVVDVIWGNSQPLMFDMSGDSGFLLTLDDFDTAKFTNFSGIIAVAITDSSNQISIVELDLLPGGKLQSEYYFSGFTGVELDQIDQIQLTTEVTLNRNSGPPHLSFSLGAFRSTAVPELNSLWSLCLLALGGLICRVKYRRPKLPEAKDVPV